MKHKKKGTAGRFLSILLAAVIALPCLSADILSPAVHAEETGYEEAVGAAGAEEDGNAVPPEESDTEDDNTEESDTEAGSTNETESGAGSTEKREEESVSAEKEDTAACVCGTLCTADSVNADCPVCGAEGYAYFNEDATPILDSPDKTLLPGPVTIETCTHEGVSGYTSNNNGTHAQTCRACGYSETAVDCAYGLEGKVESSGLTHTAYGPPHGKVYGLRVFQNAGRCQSHHPPADLWRDCGEKRRVQM